MKGTCLSDENKALRVVRSSKERAARTLRFGETMGLAVTAVVVLMISTNLSKVAGFTGSATCLTGTALGTNDPRSAGCCSPSASPYSANGPSGSRHEIVSSVLKMSTSFSANSSFGPDDVPDEATLRKAYDSWREYYGKRGGSRQVSVEFDAVRYQHFKDNYVALKRANNKAAAKARSEGREPPPPMQLNEYGDCSAEEYKLLTNTSSGNKAASTGSMRSTNDDKQTSTTIASSASPTSSYLAAAGASAPSTHTMKVNSSMALPNSAITKTPPGSTGTSLSGTSNSYYNSNLTPPPTSAPWAGGTSSASAISNAGTTTFTYTNPVTTSSGSAFASKTTHADTSSYTRGTPEEPPMNDSTTISGKTFTKMEPSSAYQGGSDGRYSYLPGGKLGNTDGSASKSDNSSNNNIHGNNPYSQQMGLDTSYEGMVGSSGSSTYSYGTTSYSFSNEQRKEVSKRGDGTTGNPSRTTGLESLVPAKYQTDAMNQGWETIGARGASTTAEGGTGGYSYSASSPPPGLTGGLSSTSRVAGGDSTPTSYIQRPTPDFVGTSTGGYVAGSASFMPPTSSNTFSGGSATFTANGQSDYLSNLSNGNYNHDSHNYGNYNGMGWNYYNDNNSNPGMANNDQFSYNANPGFAYRNYNGYSPAKDTSMATNVASEAAAPSLSPDEQAALDRARSRHHGIPKRVFDEDESEDENTDNSWAEFGMKPKPKHRREKIDFGEPILNGVANGGGISVGPNSGIYSNYNSAPPSSYSATQEVPARTSYAQPPPQPPPPHGSYTPPPAVAVAGGTSATSASFSMGRGYPTNNINQNSNPIQDRVREAYQDWCNHHGKTFEERRLPIFWINFLKMEAYCQESGTPVKQLNKYADLSPEEYRQARELSKEKSTNPAWILETPESKIESKEEFLTFGPRWGKEPPPGAEALLNKEAVDPVTGAKRDFQGEKRLRLAYQEWCNRNGKRFEESRLPAFTNNFVAMQNYCMTQNIPIKPLNEYADLTPQEYFTVLRQKQALGETIPSFGSAEASMPPNFMGLESMPPPPQQQYGGGNTMPQAQHQLGEVYRYSETGGHLEGSRPFSNGIQPELGPPQGGSYNAQEQLGLSQGGSYDGQLGPPQVGFYNAQEQLGPSQGRLYDGPQQLGPPQGDSYNAHQNLGAPQYFNGVEPSQHHQLGNTQLYPPPQQNQGQQQRPGGYGSAQAQAPGVPTGGQRTDMPGGGTGGTIPPVIIGGDSLPTSPQPSSIAAKTEAQFKAAAEARLKEFSEAKRKKKEEGEARLKRFTDRKKEAKLLSLQKNITLEEATKIVFANVTALLEHGNALLSEKVGGNVIAALSIDGSTTDEEKILENPAAVKHLSVDEEGNARKAINVDSTKNVTGKVKESVTHSPETILSGNETTGNLEESKKKHRPVVDLSAVLQIEKTAIKKEPKTASSPSDASSRANPEKLERHRSDVSYRASGGTLIDGTISVKNPSSLPKKAEAEKTKSRATPEIAPRNKTVTLQSISEVAEKEKKRANSTMAVYDAKEEALLMAQMEALQARLKSFEEARKNAEIEAKEKASEARLKQELSGKHKQVEGSYNRATDEEQRRKKTGNIAKAKIRANDKDDDAQTKRGTNTTSLREDIKRKQKEAADAKKKADDAKAELERRKREVERERRKKQEKPTQVEDGEAACPDDGKYSPLGKYSPAVDDGASGTVKQKHAEALKSHGDVERKRREAERAMTRAENERRARGETVAMAQKASSNVKESEEGAKHLQDDLKTKDSANQGKKFFASKIATNVTDPVSSADDDSASDKIKTLLRKLL